MQQKHLTIRTLWHTAIVLGLLLCSLALATTAFAADNAWVRVVHASPEAGAVDVYVDGNKLLTNFTFGTVTDYVSVPAGDHKIQVTPTGKGLDGAVITQTVTVEGSKAYTVAAIGTAKDGFGLQAFVDDNTLSGEMAKVRVYHLSPNAGPVNVATGGNTVITGLTYKNASDYLNVPAGSYTFDVTATDANATVQVPATLASGKVTSVFAVGLYKGDPALKFVAAAAAGVGGMPNTGGNPYAGHTAQFPWLLMVGGLLILLGAGAVGTRVALSRQKASR